MVETILPAGAGVLYLVPGFLVAIAAFWLLPRAARDGFLAAASFGFLTVLEPGGMLILLGLTLAVHALAPRAVTPGRRWLLPVLILGVLGYLAWHKYVPPLLAGRPYVPGAADLVLPLGISYSTFKLVHYAIDVSRGKVLDRSLTRTLLWVFLLPTFTAGPIERFDHFTENRDDRWRRDSAVEGLTRIVHGVIKKFVLAAAVGGLYTRLGGSRHLLEHLSEISVVRTWGYCVLVYLHAYLDFSAYTDIAIGASRLFGIRILENFRWPILASDLGDFWKRWHMTLTGWCQSYVYLPIIGLTRNPYAAVFATFLAIGLWHAGALTYVCWGLYHALGVVVFQSWRRYRRRRGWSAFERPIFRLAGVPLTFLFVASSFAFPMCLGSGGAAGGVRILLRLIGITTT